MDRKAHVLEGTARRSQPIDAENFLLRRLFNLGKEPANIPSDHILEQRIHWHLGGAVGRHQPAVAQYGHAIGNAGDLLQTMADVDEAHSLLSQLIDLSEEPLSLLSA